MKAFFDSLSLRAKLLLMMFSLLLLTLASLFVLYWQAERALILQVEKHTMDLSTAIQISVERLTSKGRTDEARLQDYVARLQRKGVKEISIVSDAEEVIASSNPTRVGATIDPNRRDLFITARLGETLGAGTVQKTYNLIVPIVVGNQRMGYALISMVLDDFAQISRFNFIKRLIATVLVFGRGIAHEMRNPLNFINLSIDHLQSRFPPADSGAREEFAYLVSAVKTEIHRLDTMITNFLTYGKPLKLEPRSCDLLPLLDDVARMAGGKAKEQGIEFERGYPPELPRVLVDGEQIKNSFVNVLVNAFQAMPQGGRLSIAARQVSGADPSSGSPPTTFRESLNRTLRQRRSESAWDWP